MSDLRAALVAPVTDPTAFCGFWAEPACGNHAGWRVLPAGSDSGVTTCTLHLVDAVSAACRLPASQPSAGVICNASTPTGFGHPVATCTRDMHRGGDHSAAIPGGQVYLWR